MKFIKIKVDVAVPVENTCEDCEGLDRWHSQSKTFCYRFSTKDNKKYVTIFNNRPCKQCREARREVRIDDIDDGIDDAIAIYGGKP